MMLYVLVPWWSATNPTSSGGISTPKSPRATITPSDCSRMPQHHNGPKMDAIQRYSKCILNGKWNSCRKEKTLIPLWSASFSLGFINHSHLLIEPSHDATTAQPCSIWIIFLWQLERKRVLSPSTQPVPVMSSTADGFSIFASNLILMDTCSRNIRGRSKWVMLLANILIICTCYPPGTPFLVRITKSI